MIPLAIDGSFNHVETPEVDIVSLFYFSHSGTCINKATSHRGLLLVTLSASLLVTGDFEYPVCILAINIPSFVKSTPSPAFLPIFKLDCHCKIVIFIFSRYQPFVKYVFYKYFVPESGLPFHFNCLSKSKTFYILMSILLIFVSSGLFKLLLSNPMPQLFFLFFFYRFNVFYL